MKLNLTTGLPPSKRRNAIMFLKIHLIVEMEVRELDDAVITFACNISQEKLDFWRRTKKPIFEQARQFWCNTDDKVSYSLVGAEQLWTDMILSGDDA